MTRREKFLKIRARFMRRRERARNQNSIFGSRLVFGKVTRLGYNVVWSSTGEQSPQSENPATFAWDDFLPPFYPAVPFVQSPAAYREPPHVSILPPFKRPNVNRPSSADVMLVGFHRRRVQKWGRKPNRLTKRQRAIWLANNMAWREGFFPDWDPLARHPSATDIDNGAPYYSGPFPHGL